MAVRPAGLARHGGGGGGNGRGLSAPGMIQKLFFPVPSVSLDMPGTILEFFQGLLAVAVAVVVRAPAHSVGEKPEMYNLWTGVLDIRNRHDWFLKTALP